MRLKLLIFCPLACAFGSPAAALELGGTVLVDGQLRIALVIGQGAVGEAATRAGADAEDMADALTAVGFSVRPVSDADAAELTAAIDAFADRAATADVAFVVYAGTVLEDPDGAQLAALPGTNDETPPAPRDLADAAGLGDIPGRRADRRALAEPVWPGQRARATCRRASGRCAG